MGTRISQLVFLLCFGFNCTSVLAQASADADQAQDGAVSAATEQQEEEVADSDTQDGEASGQDIAQVDEENTDSAGRFIPTEQLSQDLGASFPVDI